MRVYKRIWRLFRYMKVYEGIWRYMEVYKVYPDILKKSYRRERKGREGMGRETKEREGQRKGNGKGKGKGKKREGERKLFCCHSYDHYTGYSTGHPNLPILL